MGAIIYIDGSLTADRMNTIIHERFRTVLNGWKELGFRINGDEIKLAWDTMEGLNPLEDGVYTPLKELMRVAIDLNVKLNGSFTINSNWSDYDNLSVIVSENDVRYVNTEVINAPTDELIRELMARGILPINFKVA